MAEDHVTRREEFGHNEDGAGRDQTAILSNDETDTLISADKVIGTVVFNAAGERLGSIDQIMLNKRSGRVAYAVMSFGGFLGIGERYHPLPWARLTYDDARGGYNIDLSADELAAAPHFAREDIERIDAGAHGATLRNHFGVTSW